MSTFGNNKPLFGNVNTEKEINIKPDIQKKYYDTVDALRERGKNELSKFYKDTETQYYFSVCFKTEKEKELFLKNIGFDGDEIIFSAPEFCNKLNLEYFKDNDYTPKLKTRNLNK